MSVRKTATSQRTIAIGGSELSVVEAGFGPPLLLGHGYLWDSGMWAPQIEALASHYRLIMPELWGHGGSGDVPRGTRSLEDVAAQMLQLLDVMAIERCVVIGAAAGAMWGAHLAAMAPERVAGLVLMNSYLGLEPRGSAATYAAILDQVEIAGEVPPQVSKLIVSLLFAADIDWRHPGLPAELHRRISAFSTEQLRRSIVPLGRLIFGRRDARSMLTDIEAPSLVITADGDQARPPHESREMAHMLDAQLVTISHCGHTATLEQPQVVNEVLGNFLTALGWEVPVSAKKSRAHIAAG
jgi:pimeloyl-ACP methyl ester carboxylesterase